MSEVSAVNDDIDSDDDDNINGLSNIIVEVVVAPKMDAKLTEEEAVMIDYDIVCKYKYMSYDPVVSRIKATKRHVLMQYVYNVTLCWVLVYLMPLILLFVLNVLLIKEVRKAQQTHAQMTQQEEEKNNLAVTLNIIVMVGVFLICQTPDFVHIVISWKDIKLDQKIAWQAFYVSISLLSLNASINFLVYCGFYRGFRKVLKKIMCGSKGDDDVNSGTSNAPKVRRGANVSSKTASTDV